MKNMILVIHETDHSDNDKDVIGVADSPENAEKIIAEYYGNDMTEISHTDIGESNLEWQKKLSVIGVNDEPYEVTVCLEWFEINRI